MGVEEEGRESDVMRVIGVSGCRGGGQREMTMVGVCVVRGKGQREWCDDSRHLRQVVELKIKYNELLLPHLLLKDPLDPAWPPSPCLLGA